MIEQRAIGCLLGLAVGDAVGTTLEFRDRDSYTPLADMIGGGPFRLKPGGWTDDTSMALALADSLISHPDFNADDLMQRFQSWYQEGKYSHTGTCFDIGVTTRIALRHYEYSHDPIAGSTEPDTAGNGSLMRLAPVPIWGVRHGEAETRRVARLQSATTHGAATCLDACEGYALILRAALLGVDFETAVQAGQNLAATPPIDAILAGSWRDKQRDAIQSTGYVAHSLEASLWCVAQTGNFRDAVLLAANLGHDADTTAAITGQLAGARYGEDGIPAEWRERVAWGPEIRKMALALLQ